MFECTPEADAPQRLQWLQSLHEAVTHQRWWAAQAAVAQLEADAGHDAQALKLWRGRLKEDEAAEQRAWDELTEPPYAVQGAREEMRPFERAQLEAELARWPQVRRAWLLRKNVREFPSRRYRVLVAEMPSLDEAEAWATCRDLERQLSLPDLALVLYAGPAVTLNDLQRLVGAPAYPAAR